MNAFEQAIIDASNFVWGTPLFVLLVGGSVFFMFYSRFAPLRYLRHSIDILRGKYDKKDDPGQISHFQALSSSLAATIGMGNISGVAVAIATGGPGAIFWMWVSALFGMATKFFTCTLAVMYRGKDSNGEVQGGPMYFIVEGMGKNWKPLAIFFCIAGFFGSTPIFQTHQLIEATNDILLRPNGWVTGLYFNLSMGIGIAILTSLVIFGGITRIASVATRLVPLMVLLYCLSGVFILIVNSTEIIPSFFLILKDAFTAEAAMGGAVGSLIVLGARRAAFSNEAGIGTAPMMHGAAKTKEPVQEGLVAMLGPAIDTMIVCTMTGLCIIVTGAWQVKGINGIVMTGEAFSRSIPVVGSYVLLLCVFIFAITTIFGFAYYGIKCLSFLVGPKYGTYFNYWYVCLILVGSVSSIEVVVAVIDLAYGLMAFPTMIAALYLGPQVLKAAKIYFSKV